LDAVKAILESGDVIAPPGEVKVEKINLSHYDQLLKNTEAAYE